MGWWKRGKYWWGYVGCLGSLWAGKLSFFECISHQLTHSWQKHKGPSCSTTRVGYGSRKSSLSCQSLCMVQMHIMLLRDPSCLKLKARSLSQNWELLFLTGCVLKFCFFYRYSFLFSHLHLHPRITGRHPSHWVLKTIISTILRHPSKQMILQHPPKHRPLPPLWSESTLPFPPPPTITLPLNVHSCQEQMLFTTLMTSWRSSLMFFGKFLQEKNPALLRHLSERQRQCNRLKNSRLCCLIREWPDLLTFFMLLLQWQIHISLLNMKVFEKSGSRAMWMAMNRRLARKICLHNTY